MKRNLYAALLLLVICCVTMVSDRYVSDCAGRLRADVNAACQNAQAGQYAQAQQALCAAAETGRQRSRLLFLLVRRSLLDEINESLALLPEYAQPDNLADLCVECARVTAQLTQLEESYGAIF